MGVATKGEGLTACAINKVDVVLDTVVKSSVLKHAILKNKRRSIRIENAFQRGHMPIFTAEISIMNA